MALEKVVIPVRTSPLGRLFSVCFCVNPESDMNISIIIPTLQEVQHIPSLVPYLRQHGGEAVREILVVDGGSTDGTVEAARAAGAMVWQVPKEGASRAAQMNLGAAHATGQVLYFVHADTLPPTTFASDIQKALRDGYVMGCYRYQFDSPRWILKFNAWFVRFQWLWCQGGDKTFFILPSVFHAYQGYNPRFVVMEEYDFLRRATQRYQLYIIPKNVVVSARKYANNSWLRVQIANAVAFFMFRRHAEPSRIRDIYKRILR